MFACFVCFVLYLLVLSIVVIMILGTDSPKSCLEIEQYNLTIMFRSLI